MQIRQFMCGDNISALLQHMSFLQVSLPSPSHCFKKERNVNYANHVKLELVFSVLCTRPNFCSLLHWGVSLDVMANKSFKLLVPIVAVHMCT